MIWVLIFGLIILIIIIRFATSLNKDTQDLQGRTVADKFKFTVSAINEAAFRGDGKVIEIDKREFNLYKQGENQMINFLYSTGHLNITWRYKYFQKEVVHKKTFNDVRNISMF